MSEQRNPRTTLRCARHLMAAIVLAASPLAASAVPGAGTDLESSPSAPAPSGSARPGSDQGRTSSRPAVEPLDLDACVRIALSENPGLRAALEGVAASVESIGIARAAYYPEVSLDGGYRRFDTHVFLPSGLPMAETTLGATDDWSAGVSLGYSLFDSGVRRSELRAAAAGAEAAEQDARRARQDVVFSVHQGYYRVLSAEAWRAAALAREERVRDHLRLAETLEEAGAVPHADVLRARVEHADARLGIVRAESELRIARGDLATAMGLPASTPLEIESRTPTFDDASGEPESALARALAGRPELAAARERITAAEERVAAVEGSYGPRVEADVAFGVRDSELLPEDHDWSVGVAVRLPVFSGHAKKHRVELATLETKVLEAEAEALANEIGREVWAAKHELESAAESVRQTAEILAEAEESLAFSRARYRAGAGTINDLLDAESTLTQADSGHVDAELGYRLAVARLLRVQGDL